MRKYNFDEYRKKNLSAFSIRRAEIDSTKTTRKRPRPEEEWKVFFILSKKRWERWSSDGLVKKTGKRKYLLKI